jgi:hypothetical protein
MNLKHSLVKAAAAIGMAAIIGFAVPAAANAGYSPGGSGTLTSGNYWSRAVCYPKTGYYSQATATYKVPNGTWVSQSAFLMTVTNAYIATNQPGTPGGRCVFD